MNKINDTLKNFGLTSNEINIYKTSLSLGESTSSILGKKVGLTRSTARYTCQSLVSKRIMTVIKKKDYFLFTAEQPKKLISILNKEYNTIDKKIKNIQAILPDLESLITPYASTTKIKYYTGVDGIIDILEDTLNDGKDVY
jgi:sugar-specific transcriptional regulator TrmB